jgi:hypothetical protein
MYKAPYSEVRSLATKENWALERKNYNTELLIAKRDKIIRAVLDEQGRVREKLTGLFDKGVSRLSVMGLEDDKDVGMYLNGLAKVVDIGDRLYGMSITRQSLGEVLNVERVGGNVNNGVQFNVATTLAQVGMEARGRQAVKEMEGVEV